MLLKPGEKAHVITRRLFDNDLRRHFAGEVQEATETAVRLEGFVFVFDSGSSQFVRRPERRVRIIGLADSGQIVNVIPQTVNLEELSYGVSSENRTIITDGKSFSLEVNEFSAYR